MSHADFVKHLHMQYRVLTHESRFDVCDVGGLSGRTYRTFQKASGPTPQK